MSNVVILDYNMGNLDSISRAVDECGGNPDISDNWQRIGKASHIILPGVGNFYAAIQTLKRKNLFEPLKEHVINRKIPFLGICLGMQLMATKGFEGGVISGLGFIPGEVVPFSKLDMQLRIPHVGWNDVQQKRASSIFNNLPFIKDFYFVHSYYFECTHTENILGTTEYGIEFPSIIGNNENIYGVQFHPEKSQRAGFQIIKNFLSI